MRNRKKGAEKNLDFAEFAAKQAEESGEEADRSTDEWDYIPPESLRDRRTYTKHGLTPIRKQLKNISALLDGRSVEAKVIKQWRENVIRDLGGQDALSTAQRTIIDICANEMFYILLTDATILSLPSIFDEKSGRLLDVVQDRMQIADRLARQLSMLGLKRISDKKDLARMLKDASRNS